MEDFFKRIPSLVKPPKRSSPSSSRSTTPSPPPSTLPPPLPTPDIPIQLPVGPLPPPPFITAGSFLEAPVPSTSPPPSVLTQRAVSQRDRATRVFEHSPLSKQLSLSLSTSQHKRQQEQIEKQRGRYRFRRESANPRGLPSRSLSPKDDEKGGEKTKDIKEKSLISLSPTIYPTAEKPIVNKFTVKRPRSGPATTFEEILGIDGAPGVDNASFSSLDDFAFGVSGSSTAAFETGSTMCRMRKDSATRTMRAYSNEDPAAGRDYPLFSYRTHSPRSLIPAALESAITDDGSQDRMKVKSSKLHHRQAKLCTNDEASRLDIQPTEKRQEKIFESKCTNLGPGVKLHEAERPPYASSSPSGLTTLDSILPNRLSEGIDQSEYAPQVNGDCTSWSQSRDDQSTTLAESLGCPDPFGIRAAIPTQDAIKIADECRQAPFLRVLQDFLTSNARNIKARTVRVFTAGPVMNSTTDVDIRFEEPSESEEDMGTRKAKAVTRSWNRADLVTCYVFIVLLTAYFNFGSLHSVLIIKEALNDWAAKGEIKVYQFELALSMLGVTRILGIMTFAKLTNAYSRPCALFIAVLFSVGGIGVSAFAVTWESFCAGHTLFHYGRSGTFVVAQVIVADISDLSWRGCLTWGLMISLVPWIWTVPIIEKLVTGKLGWHIPIWIFFSFSLPVSIPPVTAAYVFHRRAYHLGYFPATKNVHWHTWWSLTGFCNRVALFSIEYDALGVLLWTVGVGLLTTALSLSEKMKAGIGIWMARLLVGGNLAIITLVAWEMWLNSGLNIARNLTRQEIPTHEHPARQIDHSYTENHINAAADERTMIPGPAGYDPVSADQLAANMSARIVASQDPRRRTRWRGFGYCRGKSHPLFRTRLLKRRTILLGCLIGFLANFAIKVGAWAVWERPEHLPLNYGQLIQFVQGNEMLANIEFTSLAIAGLFVSIMIRTTKLFKWFVVSGLFLIINGLLIFHHTDISLIKQRQLVSSQILIGLGAGMVWIGLIVGIQASCRRHSDVAISIGLLTTFNALGEMVAEAMKRLMQTYLLNLLPSDSSQEDFIRALNGHWGIMLLVAIAAAAFALLMSCVGLPNHNLDEVKQHGSGVVFGIDDTERQSSDEEHPSWATPEPFIPSHTSARIQPSESISQAVEANEESMQAAGENIAIPKPLKEHLLGHTLYPTSKSLKTTSFAQSRTEILPINDTETKNLTGTRGHGSTSGWETSTPESIVNESRMTNGLHTITFPYQVPSSYMDSIFTMETDLDKTPKAPTPGILRLHNDVNEDFINPLPIDTSAGREQDTIKRGNSKTRSINGHSIVTKSNIACEREFSFKRQEIAAFTGGQGISGNIKIDDEEKESIRSDFSSSESMDPSINGSLSNFDRDSIVTVEPIQVPSSPVNGLEWKIVDQHIGSKQPDSQYQLTLYDSDIRTLSEHQNDEDLGSKRVSTEFSSCDLAVVAPGGTEAATIQQRQNPRVDGRVSRFSYRDDVFEEPILSKASVRANTSQLSIAEITSEIDALAKKNCCSPVQFLSPVVELSYLNSFKNITTLPLDGAPESLNSSSKKVLIKRSLLPSDDHRISNELEELESRRCSLSTADTAAKREEEKGNKSRDKDRTAEDGGN